MSVESVRGMVEKVESLSGDPEAAHSAEDQTLVAALQMIAEGCDDSAAVAREALRVREIDFPRWYA